MKKRCVLLCVGILAFLLVIPVSAGGSTAMVYDIDGTSADSNPAYLTAFNGKLYFAADDGTNGIELFGYAGSGTPTMVANIAPLGADGDPKYLTVYSNKLYFSAQDEAGNTELWVYSGSGSPIEIEIRAGSSGSGPQYMAVFDGALYFSADGGDGFGRELWKYTEAGGAVRVTDIRSGANGSWPSWLCVYNGMLYFNATNGTNGDELFKYTPAGGAVLIDVNPYGSSDPWDLTVYDGKLYFAADSGSGNGTELWSYDGIGGSSEGNIHPTGNSDPFDLTVFDGSLYFHADNGTNGFELYRYTTGGTPTMVADINPGVVHSMPSDLAVYDQHLYFKATDPTYGRELWRYDGATAPELAADINAGGDSTPSAMTVFDGRLYFSADDGTYGNELWYHDHQVMGEMFYSQAAYDGWVLESGENTNAGGLINTSNLICNVGDDPQNKQFRTILHFNTSRIPDDAVVTKVTLQYKQHSIIGSDPYATHGNLWADIKDGFFSNNAALVVSDFAAGPSMGFGGNFVFIPSTLAYPIYRTTLKDTAYQYINLDGITQFRLRFAIDDDNDNTADYLKIFCGDMGVPFNRPVLRVWYYVP